MVKSVSFFKGVIGICIMTLLSVFTFQFSFAQNPTDDCASAPLLTPGNSCTPISFAMNGASFTAGGDLSGCQGQNRDDGWYKFTGTGGMVNIKTKCTLESHVLAVWSACGGPLIVCHPDAAVGVETFLTIPTTLATTYYIQIHRTSGNLSASLNGTICLSNFIYPGGISNGLGSWYSADGRLTTTGANVNAWNNNVGGYPNLTTSVGPPTVVSNLANFNPAVQFDGNDNMSGPANGTTFVGTNTGSFFMVNNYHSGAVIAKWEQTGTPINRVSMEGMGGNNIRYDHPTEISYMINSPTVAKDAWILSAGMADPSNDILYINGLNEGTDLGGSNTPSAAGFVTFGANTDGSWRATTDIAEVIFYTTTLAPAERNKVESYLSTKYGITLGSTSSPVDYTASTGLIFWSGSSTYQNDIAGIGRDDVGNLSQKKSKSVNSDGLVTMALTDGGGTFAAPNTFDSNLEFMLWGNDNASLTESAVEVPSGYAKRLPREWQVQETGTVGNVSIQFDINSLTVSGTGISDFYLMIDEDKDGNFLTGTIRIVSPTSFAGGILSFDGVNFAHGEIFSLITDVNIALPLEFVSIKVEGDENQNVITWVVGGMVNSSYFEILKSIDGANWTSIGKVNSNGVQEKIFSYIDADVRFSTTSYYRIKEVGLNGEVTYSEIASLTRDDSSKVHFVAYPNPAKQNLFIQLYKAPIQDENFEIVLYSPEGKILYREQLYDQKNQINLDEFAPGTYIVELRLWNDTPPERKILVIQY